MEELLANVKTLEKLAAEHRAVKQRIGETQEEQDEASFFKRLEDQMSES